MKIPALITMLLSQGTVVFFALYFLVKVLRAPVTQEESLKGGQSETPEE
ncbi:MAG: hypothetical protein ACO3GL_07565 [Bacteroidia bacterium]|jgi:hypothetical protein